ncbi:MAG: hypothetical protein R3217_10630 [Gammaproteobacteria bacterium]|nr:hypothetical protein [Gammaproteobacteria bacterium]
MSYSTVRIGFYGHDALYDFPANEAELNKLLDAVKRLALRHKDVTMYYELGISEDTTAIISVREIQTITFMRDGKASDPGVQVVDTDSLRDQSEAAFFLKGQTSAFRLDMDKGGPLAGMIEALLDAGYDDEDIGCVMLSDKHDNPIFLMLDEIQFAVFDHSVVEH